MAFALAKLLLILIAAGALLWALIVFLMARALLRPQRMTDGRALAILRRLSPGDLGLPFGRLEFTVRDDRDPATILSLAAWWIPAPVNLGRCMVLLHGYTDAKVGAIAWAPTFLSLGWNILAIDLRGHGESGGEYVTAGFFERHDVSQIIDQIKARDPASTRVLAIFGVSFGAAVAVATTDLRGGRDISAVILDCPFADFVSAARTHAEFHGLPGPMFQAPALRLAQRLSGADFHAVAPARLIPHVPCPVMAIHGDSDLFIAPQDMDLVEAAMKLREPGLGPTVYWRCRQTHHVLALRTDPLEFARRIAEFLDQALAWQAVRQVPAPAGNEEVRP